MSSAPKPKSKPKPTPRPRQKLQKASDRTVQDESELQTEKEQPLKGEKRNFFKLNLTQEDSNTANENNTANNQQHEDLACSELDILGENASNASKKAPSDCGKIEKVKIYDVKDKIREFSASKVDLNPGSDTERPSLDVKSAEVIENIGSECTISKQSSGNVSLEVESIVVEKAMESEYLQESSQARSAKGFDQTVSQKDNSTLNVGLNEQDFLCKASDCKQLDVDSLNDGKSTLNDPKSSISDTDDHGFQNSNLNHELDGKGLAKGVQELNKNISDESVSEFKAAKVENSTSNGQKKDIVIGGTCSPSHLDSNQAGNSNLNDGIQPITMTKQRNISDTNQPESELKAVGNCNSNLDDQKREIPPSNTSQGENTALNDIIQPILTTVTVLEVCVFENVGANKSELLQDAAKAGNSTLREDDERLFSDPVSSELPCENEQGGGKLRTSLETGLVGQSKEIVQNASNLSNIGLDTSGDYNLCSEALITLATPPLRHDTSPSPVATPSERKMMTNDTKTEENGKNDDSMRTALELGASNALATPILVITTPTLGQTTPNLGQTTPTLGVDTPNFEKIGKNVDSDGKTLDSSNQSCATFDQKQQISSNPTPVETDTPISNQATPTASKTPPLSNQATPTMPESSAASSQALDRQTSLPQDTPLPDAATPAPLVAPPPRLARLRGYLMKRGGALKAWKQRWFVFAEERNALVYFRTPRDLTPLGQVCLGHAHFTCEGAEPGVFYMHTPEKTVTLKAQSDELKFYWLQQLQQRRWIHSPNTAPSDTANTTGAELFPQLECVEEVNTEETTSQPFLLQFSLKHPLIELQNSVQILRRRSSNDSSQSVFHIPTPSLTSPTSVSANPIAEIPLSNQETGANYKSTFRRSSPAIFQATPLSSQTPLTSTLTPPTAGTVTMRRRSRTFLRRSISSWSERGRLQQELQDQKDLVVVLQKALELCQAEKRSSRMDQKDQERSTEGLEDLGRSSGGLEDLRRLLDQSQAEVEELRTTLTQQEQTIQELNKEVRELSEKNIVKQQVIEKLSSSVSRWAEESSDVDQSSVQNLVQQNQDLQDDLKAFRKQNHFLNSEIHHLSGLWRTSTESQRVLMKKVSVQRGQYLRVLRELQEVSLRDGAQSEALKNIIQNALSLEQSQLQAQVQRDRDQYGFQLVQDFEVEDLKLLIKIQAPDLRSTQSQDAVERPLVARWDQFMSGCRGELSPSPELKSLIRTGVPPHLRPQVWNWIIRTRTQRDQDPLQYQQLCEQMESSPQSGSRPWSRQIDLDLPRTLCTNQNFSSATSPALQQLRRILLAFSWENPNIGYCQGLNRIAGLLLLVLGSEEDTFWALKAVVENIMPPEYYSPSLVGSQADQLVLKDFLAEKLPRVSSHLERCGVDVSSSTFTWFLVVFVEVLPSHLLLPLWDAFLYEGSKVLFRFSLALFKLKESEILQLSSPLELHQYFRVLPKTVPDYRRLSAVAFDELNPFSRRAVRSRRALHLERLQRELRDLRQQQSLFLSQRSVRKSTDDEREGGEEVEEELDNNSEED